MKQCPYGRGILGGVVVGIYGWLVGGLVWMNLFKEATLVHASLWRPHGDPLMMKGMIVAYLVFGLFYSLLYAKLSRAMTCVECPYQRAAAFGFLCWLPFGFGCGLFWYTLSPVSMDLLFAAWIDKALFLIGGAVILKVIYGCTLECCDENMACETPAPKKAVAKKPAKKKK